MSDRRVLPAVSAGPVQGAPKRETVGVTSPRAPWTLLLVEWDDPRAVALRDAMDAELSLRYADRFSAFDAETSARFERDFALDPATVVATVLLVRDDVPVGHAALRVLPTLGDELEVKRVFVHQDARGSGASRALMAELERIGRERGAARLILQTGDRQPDAVALYERIGYTGIPIFPPYSDFDFSLCFEKPLAGVLA